MNRRTFLSTLLAVVTLPKAVMSKATPPFRLSPIGKRWDMRAAEVLKVPGGRKVIPVPVSGLYYNKL